MAGVEIIGLLLGGLPLIISAAEHYKKGFEPLRRWMRFKFVFRDFITSVDIQRQMFHLILKKLLIRVRLPPEEKQRLLTEPNYEGWSHPNTVDAMKSRLGGAYEVCMDILTAMKEDLLKLQVMMCLENGNIDWARPGKKQWKYQAKRIQWSFSKHGTQTVHSLEEKLQNLNALLSLLDGTDDEYSHGAKAILKDTTWTEPFECIRRHAISLHSAIRDGWNCNCEGHTAGLQLQKRVISNWSSQFTMTFDALAPLKNDQESVYSRRRVLIIPKEPIVHLLPGFNKPKPSPIQDPSLDQLRTEFDSELLSQSTTTTLSANPSTHFSSTISSKFTSLRSIFMHNNSNLMGSSTSTTPIGKDIKMENNHCKKRKTSNFNHLPMTKRGVSFAMDLAKPKNTPYTQTPATSFNKSVSLPKAPAAAEESSANNEINDLCSTLNNLGPKSTRLGYLSDCTKQKHELYCLTEEITDSRSIELISLEKCLAVGGHLRLNWQKRHKVACILASSLLQLQTTPWLSGNLKKNSIIFYYQKNESEILIDQPYISHSFCSTKSSHYTSGNITADEQSYIPPRANLMSLGILLLELRWNQVFENQTSRKGHLSSDGPAIDGTELQTAIVWLDKVDEEDPMLRIINWCLFCPYEGKPDWADVNFMQAVYTNVVQPLEMIKL